MLLDNQFYKVLKSKKDVRSKYYASFVEPLYHDISPILENIKVLFPEFPDHGTQHSLRILDYLSRILSKETIKKMSSLELFVLIFSALLHDSGMSLYNAKEGKEEIRKAHHLFSQKVIDFYFDHCLQQIADRDRIKRAVTFVSVAHGLTLDELLAHPLFDESDIVDTFEIRYWFLAFCLRVGDLMDLEAGRAGSLRMKLFGHTFDSNSFDHNERNMHVEQYNYSPTELEIKVKALNPNQDQIWKNWFLYLREDIEKCNALYSRKGLSFPIPKTTIIQEYTYG